MGDALVKSGRRSEVATYCALRARVLLRGTTAELMLNPWSALLSSLDQGYQFFSPVGAVLAATISPSYPPLVSSEPRKVRGASVSVRGKDSVSISVYVKSTKHQWQWRPDMVGRAPRGTRAFMRRTHQQFVPRLLLWTPSRYALSIHYLLHTIHFFFSLSSVDSLVTPPVFLCIIASRTLQTIQNVERVQSIKVI